VAVLFFIASLLIITILLASLLLISDKAYAQIKFIMDAKRVRFMSIMVAIIIYIIGLQSWLLC